MNLSKRAILNAFWALLEEKPYSKITVKDIVDRCGVNRNTFYYHFQDIPSLLEEFLTGQIDLLIEKHCRVGSLEECVSLLVGFFADNRRAALHIYSSQPRDIFIRRFDGLLMYLVEEYVDSIAQELSLQLADRTVVVRFYKCLLMGVFLDWLDSGMAYDLQHYCAAVLHRQEGARIQFFLGQPPAPQ
uniref:HTH tetR-type domain-containing protein n=1 Tax=uncultured prokaryote TaxID=198431 RepID=A0A0H5PY92_9ZZZZ|nr:hypothetical protein [uncultured prokaryote]